MIKKIIAIVVIFVAAVGGVAMLYVTNLLGQVNHVDGTENTADVTGLQAVNATSEGGNNIDLTGIDTNVLSDDDIKNILIIGQDRREGETGRTRSDTMIICSINTKTNKIYLTSLMRDMYVPIPGYGANRINAAYVFGGMDLLDSVIEQDFGVKIDGNVEVDFDGLSRKGMPRGICTREPILFSPENFWNTPECGMLEIPTGTGQSVSVS